MGVCKIDGVTPYCVPTEQNGGVPVNVQDQTTEPLDALFARSISNFSIAIEIPASGLTALNYSFTAVAGHGIAPADEILLLDVAADRSFFAVVINVVLNIITVDRPVDHTFPVTSLGRIVSTNMNVNGSITPVIYTLRTGSIPTDIVRFIVNMTDDTAMDFGTFGGIGALTNGLVLRIFNSFQKTVFCFKTNGEIAQFCFDTLYAPRAPAGSFGFSARITFGGQDKHGVVIRIQNDDVIQWVVQDDLTGLVSLQVAAEGHLVQD